MAENKSSTKGFTPDWLVRGILTKIGDTFDRLTGRGWKPSSTLATSELIERLKALLDAEVREDRPSCKFVPHNIKLTMQWDKFSTDSEKDLRKLEAEMLSAVVDHINDKRYFTHAPLLLEIKPDYFTPGVRLLVSFEIDEEHEAAIHLSVPGQSKGASDDEQIVPHKAERTFTAIYTLNGAEKTRSLPIAEGVRISVGRTKENGLFIDDPSISKIHASLTINGDGKLIAADTGSTNGTFIGDQRIPYGKTLIVGDAGTVKFGNVEVKFKPEYIPRPSDSLHEPEATLAFPPQANELKTKVQHIAPLNAASQNPAPAQQPFVPAATEPSIPAPTLPSVEVDKKE
jgi:pSer/pThr/pTyr-binding forkhead associated (FHA) protein